MPRHGRDRNGVNFDRHRAHKHRWFSEALCELASLFVLHRLAAAWAEDPPDGVAEAAAFAPNFATYAVRVMARHARPGDLPRWLAERCLSTTTDGIERHHMTSAAAGSGVPYGRDHKQRRDGGQSAATVPGRSLTLARLQPAELLGSVIANATFRDYLDAWARHLGRAGSTPRVPPLIRASFYRPHADTE